MKPFFKLIVMACLCFGVAHSVKAQTVLYENNITSASDVSTWTLLGAAWLNASTYGSSLFFLQANSSATTPAIIPAGAIGLSLTVSARFGNRLVLYTSPDGVTFTYQGYFTGSSAVANATKTLPDGTRYLKFMMPTVVGIDYGYLFSVKVTSTTTISLYPTVLNIPVGNTGNTGNITAVLTPAATSSNTVMWSSSNPAVATVSSTSNNTSGKVSGIAPGTAIITATAINSRATARCTVTVHAPVTGVVLNKASANIEIGKAETLTATVQPTNATNKAVSWKSNNTAVA
ncbi:MAG: Ig-like domain-containing protein, partial [Bacteroidales bacterium]|nr:Ig-like domain-containing protein [Bacteroidales bacterium]